MYFKEPTNVNNCHYQFTKCSALFRIVLKEKVAWWTVNETVSCTVYVRCTLNFALKLYIYTEREMQQGDLIGNLIFKIIFRIQLNVWNLQSRQIFLELVVCRDFFLVLVVYLGIGRSSDMQVWFWFICISQGEDIIKNFSPFGNSTIRCYVYTGL